MTITPETFVADVATAQPAAVKVFQRYNIDFCCGGQQPIRSACESVGAPLQRVLDELQTAAASGTGEGRNWSRAPLTALVRHISETYHAPQADELRRLNGMMDKVEAVHGARMPDLLQPLAQIVRGLTQELLFHTVEEEDRLFPAIEALDRRESVALHGRALDRFLEKLQDEHVTVGRMLRQMRDLTEGFVVPSGACATFQGLYHGLGELSASLHEHVHLENHVLFPRAAALGRARADGVDEA